MATAKKLVTIVGATGAQGGSVVDYLLKSKSQEYTIRAVTRSPSSAAAKALAARGIEIVQAELTDAAALSGDHTPFSRPPTSGAYFQMHRKN